jgi:hypothetical protein
MLKGEITEEAESKEGESKEGESKESAEIKNPEVETPEDEMETPQMTVWVTIGLLAVVTVVSYLVLCTLILFLY